jgi:hypothetical protein
MEVNLKNLSNVNYSNINYYINEGATKAFKTDTSDSNTTNFI